MSLVDLVVSCGLARSKSEARRLIQGGGIYLNNIRIGNVQRAVSLTESIEGQVFILRKGPKEYHLIRVAEG